MAGRRSDLAKSLDSTMTSVVNKAVEIATASELDDFSAWREWDGLADMLPNYTVRQLIKKVLTYERTSSTSSSTTPKSATSGGPSSGLGEG
jgi:hypothetical protein